MEILVFIIPFFAIPAIPVFIIHLFLSIETYLLKLLPRKYFPVVFLLLIFPFPVSYGLIVYEVNTQPQWCETRCGPAKGLDVLAHIAIYWLFFQLISFLLHAGVVGGVLLRRIYQTWQRRS